MPDKSIESPPPSLHPSISNPDLVIRSLQRMLADSEAKVVALEVQRAKLRNEVAELKKKLEEKRFTVEFRARPASELKTPHYRP